MPLILLGAVLLFVIAVFAPYIVAIAAAFILGDRLGAAFLISLIPVALLFVSMLAVYIGFQGIRQEFHKPRRHLGSGDAKEE